MLRLWTCQVCGKCLDLRASWEALMGKRQHTHSFVTSHGRIREVPVRWVCEPCRKGLEQQQKAPPSFAEERARDAQRWLDFPQVSRAAEGSERSARVRKPNPPPAVPS